MYCRAHERASFLGRNNLASKIGIKLVDLNPNRNYEYLKKLGISYLMTGKNVEAENVFNKMRQIDPSDGFANVHLAFAVKVQNKVFTHGKQP